MKKEFSQERIAKFLGYSQSSICQWKRGRPPLNKNTYKIEKAVRYLNLLMKHKTDKQKKCELIRNEFGIKVESVACFLNVSPSTVYLWEKGGRRPNEGNINVIKQRIKSLRSLLIYKKYFLKTQN